MDHLTRTASRGRLTAVIAVTLAVFVFSAAGAWQLHRASFKDELRARAESAMHDPAIELSAAPAAAADLEFHAVQARGEWLATKSIFIDNKIRDGIVGYHVVTPLRIAGSNMHVLVNRGWIAAPALRSELPNVPTPPGTLVVVGIARSPTTRFLELSKQAETGQVWQNLTIDRFRAWSGLALQPIVIYQQGGGDDKLERVPVAPEASGLSADRHRAYALTWFGLAIVTFILGVTASLKS